MALRYNLNVDILKPELNILSTTIKKYEAQIGININGLINLVNPFKVYKVVFNETYRLAVIFITIYEKSNTKWTFRKFIMYMKKKFLKILDLEEFVERFFKNRKIVLH